MNILGMAGRHVTCSLLALLCIAIMGCEDSGNGGGSRGGSSITRAKWDQVSVPMDFDSLVGLFGQPTHTSEVGNYALRAHVWQDAKLNRLAVSEGNGRIYSAEVRITDGNTTFGDTQFVCQGAHYNASACDEYVSLLLGETR